MDVIKTLVFQLDQEDLRPTVIDLDYNNIGSISEIRVGKNQDFIWILSRKPNVKLLYKYDLSTNELILVHTFSYDIFSIAKSGVEEILYIEKYDLVKSKEGSHFENVKNIYKFDANNKELYLVQQTEYDANLRFKEVEKNYVYIYGMKDVDEFMHLYDTENDSLINLKDVNKLFDPNRLWPSGYLFETDILYSQRSNRYLASIENKIYSFDLVKNSKVKEIIKFGKYDIIQTLMDTGGESFYCYIRHLRTGKKRIVEVTIDGIIVFEKEIDEGALDEFFTSES
jgi:hypothetical protein